MPEPVGRLVEEFPEHVVDRFPLGRFDRARQLVAFPAVGRQSKPLWLILTGLAAALPVLMDKMPPVWFLLLCAVVPLAAAVARLVDQPKMRGDE